MEAWLPPLGFAPSIGAVRWPLYVGLGIEGFGPSSGPPPVVVVVGGTCRRPKRLLLRWWFPRTRSGVINRPPEPKIVQLEGWEERELFSDGLDEGF